MSMVLSSKVIGRNDGWRDLELYISVKLMSLINNYRLDFFCRKFNKKSVKTLNKFYIPFNFTSKLIHLPAAKIQSQTKYVNILDCSIFIKKISTQQRTISIFFNFFSICNHGLWTARRTFSFIFFNLLLSEFLGLFFFDCAMYLNSVMNNELKLKFLWILLLEK